MNRRKFVKVTTAIGYGFCLNAAAAGGHRLGTTVAAYRIPVSERDHITVLAMSADMNASLTRFCPGPVGVMSAWQLAEPFAAIRAAHARSEQVAIFFGRNADRREYAPLMNSLISCQGHATCWFSDSHDDSMKAAISHLHRSGISLTHFSAAPGVPLLDTDVAALDFWINAERIACVVDDPDPRGSPLRDGTDRFFLKYCGITVACAAPYATWHSPPGVVHEQRRRLTGRPDDGWVCVGQGDLLDYLDQCRGGGGRYARDTVRSRLEPEPEWHGDWRTFDVHQQDWEAWRRRYDGLAAGRIRVWTAHLCGPDECLKSVV